MPGKAFKQCTPFASTIDLHEVNDAERKITLDKNLTTHIAMDVYIVWVFDPWYFYSHLRWMYCCVNELNTPIKNTKKWKNAKDIL